jgi:CrcB protein
VRPALAPSLALVAAGAIPGALLRWQLDRLGRHLPIGLLPELLAEGRGAVLLANLAGSFLLGLLVARAGRRPRLALLGGIGFCGSFTTFSSWILQLQQLLARGQAASALLLLALSLAGGLAAAALGLSLAERSAAPRLRR